jgi:hypothetical protein
MASDFTQANGVGVAVLGFRSGEIWWGINKTLELEGSGQERVMGVQEDGDRGGKGGEGRRKGAEKLMRIKCCASVIKEYEHIHIIYLLKIHLLLATWCCLIGWLPSSRVARFRSLFSQV